MEEGFRLWANPSSPHAEGRKARALLEDARERIKAALGWTGELIFTSGASEALWIALNRAKVDRQIVSAVEHDAVFRAAPNAMACKVNETGQVDCEQLASALAGRGMPLVAIQHLNSETGAFQNVAEHAAMVREAGGILLSDCSQSAGKFTLPDCDMAVVSAHKLGGPVGIGALLVDDFNRLEPTGGQERGYRFGTENLVGALGFAAATEVSETFCPADDVLDPMSDLLGAFAESLGGERLHARIGLGSSLIEAITMPRVSAAAQLVRFDISGISISAGSACASGSLKPSRVLTAMGISPEAASRTIRVSFGWNTTRAEVERFCEVWLDMAREAS